MTGPRIAIVGGGSYQWVPKLLVDLANTPTLRNAEIVIEDLDPAPIPRMVELVEHIAAVRGIDLHASGTTDQRAALTGADFVVVSISTGGFDAMRHDLEVPERFGIRQSVGDTVGPGGIVRALRNVPVLVGIARDMEDVCPDAWMLNLTNPMTALCRAVTRETEIRTIGLCHEITIAQFMLSLMLDVSFLDLQLTVAGVNHLPFITKIDAGGRDGFALLRDLLDHADERADEPLPMALPEDLGHEPTQGSGKWTKADLLRVNQLKLECFRRYGVLPGAGDRHVAEFFPDFLTPATNWGHDWGVDLTSIADRERWQAKYVTEFDTMLAADAVDAMPSGELVAAVIQCMLTNTPGWFPLNLPNAGQVADLPPDVVVESMCVVDGSGARGRDEVTLPPEPAAIVQRVSRAQECTVEAALTGDRALVVDAMRLDPLTSRLDATTIEAMTDAMLAATAAWLPQFAMTRR
jgi:alpha-galactosidase